MIAAAALLAACLLHSAPAPAADAEVHFDRAQKAAAAGKYQEALAEYDAVLTLKGEDAAVRHNMALIYLAVGDPARARVEADRATRLAPRAGRYRITLAAACLSATQPDEVRAERELKRAEILLQRAKDAVGLADCYFNLGYIAQRRRNFEDARDWFTLALRYNPDDLRAQDALAGLGESAPGR